MAKIPQPEFILLKEAAKRLKTEVDYLLALAGEDELTLWVCYTAEQFNSQITYKGQSKSSFLELTPAHIRELRFCSAAIHITPPASGGLVDLNGNFVSYQRTNTSIDPDFSSPVPRGPARFKGNQTLEIGLEQIVVKSADVLKIAGTDDGNGKQRIRAPATYLAAAYLAVNPNGSWRQTTGISFYDWLRLQCENCEKAGPTLKLSDRNVDLIIEIELTDKEDQLCNESTFSAMISEAGESLKKLRPIKDSVLERSLYKNLSGIKLLSL